MDVVILAGGRGTRLTEFTTDIPKPMVNIGNQPILFHIMRYFSYYKLNKFSIALGYKSNVIKEYFLNFSNINSNFKINLRTGKVNPYNKLNLNWDINLIDTGLNTMTGGRLKRISRFIKSENFILTYGDGLANIDINALIKFHKKHKKLITVTAVKPIARFGSMKISKDQVISFKEKSSISDNWINGGFFVINKKFLKYIKNDQTILESEPLECATKDGHLMAYKHIGFWQCMDNIRDHIVLENMFNEQNCPWIK